MFEERQKGSKRALSTLFWTCFKNLLSYAGDREEAIEFVNDGFMKVFTKLQLYQPNYACKTG
jgi:hypothetical protein